MTCLFVCLFVCFSGFITPNEFVNMNTRGADTMMMHAGKTHPKYRARYSYQTFVNQRYLKDPILDRILERQVNERHHGILPFLTGIFFSSEFPYFYRV